MKNHRLQVMIDDQTELRLRNYCLRMRREKSDGLRILLEDALDAEDRRLKDRKLVDPPGEYHVSGPRREYSVTGQRAEVE